MDSLYKLVEVHDVFLQCVRRAQAASSKIPISLYAALAPQAHERELHITTPVEREVEARISAIRPCIYAQVVSQFNGLPQHSTEGLVPQFARLRRNAAEHNYKHVHPFDTVSDREWRRM